MLGAAVAILVALGQPAWQLAAVVIFFVVAMNLESHILIPRLMSRVLGLSPLLTIIALFVGVRLMGILGGLVALPVAAALHVIVREVVREANPDSSMSPVASATTELRLSNEPGLAKAGRPGLHRDDGYGAPVILDEDTIVWTA
jgi:predicted PurR-regulated permease PerM